MIGRELAEEMARQVDRLCKEGGHLITVDMEECDCGLYIHDGKRKYKRLNNGAVASYRPGRAKDGKPWGWRLDLGGSRWVQGPNLFEDRPSLRIAGPGLSMVRCAINGPEDWKRVWEIAAEPEEGHGYEDDEMTGGKPPVYED